MPRSWIRRELGKVVGLLATDDGTTIDRYPNVGLEPVAIRIVTRAVMQPGINSIPAQQALHCQPFFNAHRSPRQSPRRRVDGPQAVFQATSPAARNLYRAEPNCAPERQASNGCRSHRQDD